MMVKDLIPGMEKAENPQEMAIRVATSALEPVSNEIRFRETDVQTLNDATFDYGTALRVARGDGMSRFTWNTSSPRFGWSSTAASLGFSSSETY